MENLTYSKKLSGPFELCYAFEDKQADKLYRLCLEPIDYQSVLFNGVRGYFWSVYEKDSDGDLGYLFQGRVFVPANRSGRCQRTTKTLSLILKDYLIRKMRSETWEPGDDEEGE